MNSKLLILFVCIAALVSHTTAEQFELYGNFDMNSSEAIWEKLANLEVNLENDIGYIQTERLSLIPKEIISRSSKQNRFMQLKLSQIAEDTPVREYLTTIDLLQTFPSGEYKEVIEINIDAYSFANSFSYAVKPIVHTKKSKRSKEQEDEDLDETFKIVVNRQTESLKSLFSGSNRVKAQQHSNNPQNPQQKEAPPQEGGIMGFIKDNFWYIIIGFIVLNVASSFTSGAPQGAGAGQGQAARQ